MWQYIVHMIVSLVKAFRDGRARSKPCWGLRRLQRTSLEGGVGVGGILSEVPYCRFQG